ncbi:MAG: trigger factor [Clostridium sp.]
MRKILTVGICTMTAVMLLTGCSGKSKTETATASDAQTETTQAETTAGETEPYVAEGSIKLGDYKKIPVNVMKVEVTDEEVDAQIQRILDSNPSYMDVDRAAKDGDTVNIDYKGLLDGKAFDGGTAEGSDLVLGSNSFIDGFESGLVGTKKGDKKDLKLTFPAEYQNTDLAGKEVVFQVTVNAVKEKTMPVLNDEFVLKVSPEDKNVATFKQSQKDSIMEQKKYQMESQRNFDILDAIIAKSEIVCATADVDKEYDKQIQMYTSQASMYGMDLAGLASAYGMDEAGFKNEIRTMAKEAAKQRMVFDEIGKKEKITVNDADLTELAKQNKYDDSAALIEAYGEEEVNDAAMSQKIMDFLVANAVVTTVDAPVAPEAETKAE